MNNKTLMVGGLLCSVSIGTAYAVSVEDADAQPNPLQKEGWVLDVNDEFDGSQLDTSLWVPSYLEYRTEASRAAAKYEFGSCGDAQGNACLALVIDENTPTYYPDDEIKVSSIQTAQRDYLHKDIFHHSTPTEKKYTPQYGYFEIRAKGYGETGYHNAFWTTGWRDQPDQELEIDIWEDPGNNDDAFRFNVITWDDPGPNYGETMEVPGIDDEFHIYALEWTENGLNLFVDNQLVKSLNGDYSPDYPSVFYLSFYENSGWNGSADTSPSSYPKKVYIDYFRAYKRSDPTPYFDGPGTYKIKSQTYGKYLDSQEAGLVELVDYSIYDDQEWIVTDAGDGTYLIENARSGRGFLDSNPDAVAYNDGYTGSDARWSVESAGDGSYRLNNAKTGRDYMYGTSDNQLRWNNGNHGDGTKWVFEKVGG